MRVIFVTLLARIVSCAAASSAQPGGVDNNTPVVRDGAWSLAFFDDFNGTTIDAAKWSVRNNLSHCSPCEPQLYLSSRVAVADGALAITTVRDHVFGPGPAGTQLYNFSSGWVDTLHSFSQLYGRFEARMQLPARTATGAWPAFWTLPNSSQCWPVGGEVRVRCCGLHAARRAPPRTSRVRGCRHALRPSRCHPPRHSPPRVHAADRRVRVHGEPNFGPGMRPRDRSVSTVVGVRPRGGTAGGVRGARVERRRRRHDRCCACRHLGAASFIATGRAVLACALPPPRVRIWRREAAPCPACPSLRPLSILPQHPPIVSPTQVYGSYRWGTACGDDQQLLPGAGYPPSGSGVDWTAWHVFAVEWNATAMTFSVDGVEYETKTPAEAVFPTAAQYVIINTAIAWYFMPGDEAVYPATTLVDWVKVWSWV